MIQTSVISKSSFYSDPVELCLMPGPSQAGREGLHCRMDRLPLGTLNIPTKHRNNGNSKA